MAAKHCTNCGSGIPETARFCASCGNAVTVGHESLGEAKGTTIAANRRVLTWIKIGVAGIIGVTIFMVILGAIFVGADQSTSNTKIAGAATPPRQAPTAIAEPVREVSIRAMLDLYEANPIAAEAEYKGQLIQTRGIIDLIRERNFHLIPLDSDDFQSSGAECALPRDLRYLILELRKGDEVTVVGRHGGFAGIFIKTAKIKDCRIVGR